MTTPASFVSSLAGLSISGVTTSLDEPPLSLNTADLPASWTMPLRSTNQIISTCDDGMIRYCDLVIGVETIAQETQAANYAALLTMAGAVETALKTARITTWPLRFSVSIVDTIFVAGIRYWGIIGNIEGQD